MCACETKALVELYTFSRHLWETYQLTALLNLVIILPAFFFRKLEMCPWDTDAPAIVKFAKNEIFDV